MTTALNDRVAVEKAKELCHDRLLEETRGSDQSNGGIDTMDDVVKDVNEELLGSHKQLQLSKKKEEKDVFLTKKHVHETSTRNEKDMEDWSIDAADELELVQRATKLEGLVTEAHIKLTMLETEMMQIERRKKATTFLMDDQQKVKEETGIGEEGVVEETLKKRTKKSTSKEKMNRTVKEKESEEQRGEVRVELEVERGMAQETNWRIEKMQQLIDTLAQKRSETIAKCTAPLEEERVKVKPVAKLKAKLEKERSNVEQATQKSESQVVNAVATLAEKNLELERKLQTVEKAATFARSELERVQAQLAEVMSEKEARETNLEKLLKNLEDLQLANKRLMEKNAAIESDAKAIRGKAESTIAKHSMYEDKTRSLRDEVEAAKNELKMSKAEVKELQGEVERLISEIRAANANALSSKEHIAMLERELELATKNTHEVSAELESLRVSTQDLKTKNVSLEDLVQTLKQELETTTTRSEVAFLELDALRISTKDTNSSLNEQIQALKKELALMEQSTQEVSSERDALFTSMQEAERMQQEEIERLTTQLIELQTERRRGTCEESTVELEKMKDAAKAALADKGETARRLLEMKNLMNRLKLESDKALSQVSEKDSQVKKQALDLAARTVEASNVKAQYDELIVQHMNLKKELKDLRGVVGTNEDLLKKARESLLEADVELKIACAGTLQWKNSALAAKTLMNAKIADAESASKQLKKARADLSSVTLARSQLSASLEAKNKKIVRSKHELATVRAELAATFQVTENERTKLEQAHTAQIKELRELLTQSVMQLNGQVQSYRLALVSLFLLCIAVLAYVVSDCNGWLIQ